MTRPGACRRWLPAGLALTSWLLCLWVPWLSKSPTHELGGYTDHERHVALSYLAMRGPAQVYRVPYGELEERVSFAHTREWPGVTYVYPPGVLVLFAPVALAAAWTLPTQEVTAAIAAQWVLLWTHLALWACFAALAALPPGLRAGTGLLVWMVLVRAGLCGQVDGLWVGCGAMMVLSLVKARPGTALVWFGMAAALHYRAAVLLPLGALAIGEAVKGLPFRRWPRASLLICLGLCSATLAGFLAALPRAETFRNVPPLATTPGDWLFWLAVGTTIAGMSFCLWTREWLVGAMLLLVGLISVHDSRHWWHGVVVAAPLLVAGFRSPSRAPWLVRLVVAGWALGLQRVFGGRPLDGFKSVVQFVSRGG